MTITGGTALGKDEVERMVADAEKFAAEDHQRREAAEARNHADQVAYQIERFLQDDGDKIADGDKADLTKAKDDLQAVLKDEAATPEALSSAADAAMQVFQRVGQAMVQQQQQQQAAQATTSESEDGAGDAGAATESEDDVVEGEIVDEGGAS